MQEAIKPQVSSARRLFGIIEHFAPSTNYSLNAWRVQPYSLLPRNAVIYDIGGKDVRGNYMFGSPPDDAKVTVIDIAPGPFVDVVADAHDLHMIPDQSADCVLMVSMLPNVRRPWRVVEEAHRILKPGGIIFISSAFVYTFAPDPLDYYRFSQEGLEVLCEKFEKVDSGFNRGPASTMNQLMVHFCAMLFAFGSHRAFELNKIIFRYLFFWLKYLDALIGKSRLAHVIYSAAFYLGRKPR
jgi:SAM-dependent methyltransferase